MPTPIAAIPEISSQQFNKEILINQMVRHLELLAIGTAISRTLTAPPVSPVAGGIYIPAPVAPGAFAGQENKILQFVDGVWTVYQPFLNARLWSATDSNFIIWNGTAWVVLGAGVGDMLKATYDTDSDGIVDNSQLLSGNNAAYYLSRFNHTGSQPISSLSDFPSDRLMPSGGTTGQSLVKNSNTNYDLTWSTPVVNDSISGMIEFPDTKTYILDLHVKQAYNIENISIKSASGTITCAVQIDGVAVGGLNAIAVSSSESTTASSGTKLAAIGSTVALSFSSNTNSEDVSFTISIQYA
jgi:hypothetical protein